MKISEINEEAKYYLNILTAQISSPFDIDVTKHKKAIRDIMDNFEGHLHKVYNSKGNYDHGTLKYDAPHISEKAAILKETLTKNEFLKVSHREHAKPLSIIVDECKGLSGQRLLTYLYNNLKSVTILKEEATLLDSSYKTTMPDVDKVFSRFDYYEVKIIKQKIK